MLYDMNVIEEIINKANIFSIISSYTKLHKIEKGIFAGPCPFHKETGSSFYINYPDKTFCCYGCGVSGNVIDFIMHIENCNFEEAVKIIAKKIKYELPPANKEKKEDDKTSDLILKINADADLFYQEYLNKKGTSGQEYFKNRNITDETVKKFHLGYAPKFGNSLYLYLKNKGYDEEILDKCGLISYGEVKHNGKKTFMHYDKFWDRVIYPIFNINNDVIGFGGRVLNDSKPKYLNSPETPVFEKSNNLFALNIAKESKKDYLIVCEGYMDTISMHQFSFDNAVASLGTSLTENHVKMIDKLGVKNVYLAYDSDEPGIAATKRAIELFKKTDIVLKVINMNPCKDPDEFLNEYGTDAFQKRIDTSMDALRFLIKKRDKSSPEYYNEIADVILERL